MNDRMTPLAFEDLMQWVLNEKGSTFGVKKQFEANSNKFLSLFGEKLEIPMGPAAGPHTQLTQNIIASYICGARFFELKTVQQLDGEDLPVEKPCIFAPDECYNVEWSTELRVPEAFDEYAKAWFALKLISKEFGLGDPCGFIFNMSVGYDLEGIQSPKIDTFINSLKDASTSAIWQECQTWTLNHLDRFKHIDADYIYQISPHISHSITLSTLHGCPPATIESIARYLLTEKQLHTYIKCNPTLLGYDHARSLLDSLGYDYISFTDHHFTHDLQFEDAVPMFTRLLTLSATLGLQFGVKLTNTFPVKIANKELPGEEMYMSGRSLFPLTLSVAHKLSSTFNNSLKMSFSGGADAFNIKELFESGIYPITLATTLLKPGGYNRLYQLATLLSECDYTLSATLNTHSLTQLTQSLQNNFHYLKPIKPLPKRKISKPVPLIGCTTTPCSNFCPINQDIPQYIRLVGEENYEEALRVITVKNPLPFTTGTICNHNCTLSCRRNFYDSPIDIRGVKKIAANLGFEALITNLTPPIIDPSKKVAIIGGGVAGLSCAYFLARAGMNVTVFEKTGSLGGIVRHIIPEFRIDSHDLNKDIQLINAQGAKFKLNQDITSFESLKEKGFEYIVVAIGATKSYPLLLEGDKPLKVFDFLRDFKSSSGKLSLGKHVVIIGGGNTAMDAARAATRVDGVESVSIVYRRTKRYMPADEEELQLSLSDGVVFKELLSPTHFKDGKLTCDIMTLGAPDLSGRRSPISTHTTCLLPADTVISAIGETLDTSLLTNQGIDITPSGYPSFDATTLEIAPNIFSIGDCLKGPATIVKAIANAQVVANILIDRLQIPSSLSPIQHQGYSLSSDITTKKASLQLFNSPLQEHTRCLECDIRCGCCVDVCPNRANITLNICGQTEILHIDRLCNACGNCTMFCPYDSSPYIDKFTLFHTLNDFNLSTSSGVLITDMPTQSIKLRLGDSIFSGSLCDYNGFIPIKKLIATLLTDYTYLL